MLKIADFRAFYRILERSLFASVLCLFAFFGSVYGEPWHPHDDPTYHTVVYDCFVREAELDQQEAGDFGTIQSGLDGDDTGQTGSSTDTRTMCQKNINHEDRHSTGPKPVGAGASATNSDSSQLVTKQCQDDQPCGTNYVNGETAFNVAECSAAGYHFGHWECEHGAGFFVNRRSNHGLGGEDDWLDYFQIDQIKDNNSSFASYEELTCDNDDSQRRVYCYMHWEGDQHYIHYQDNSGHGTSGCTTDVSVNYGNEYSLSNTLPDDCESNDAHWEFKGWDCDHDVGFINALGAGRYELCWDFQGDLTCNARFEMETRSVTYNCGGGTGSAPAEQTAGIGDTVTLSNYNDCVAPTGSGAAFAGWYCATYDGTAGMYAPGSNMTVNGDTVCTAIWQTLQQCEENESATPTPITSMGDLSNVNWNWLGAAPEYPSSNELYIDISTTDISGRFYVTSKCSTTSGTSGNVGYPVDNLGTNCWCRVWQYVPVNSSDLVSLYNTNWVFYTGNVGGNGQNSIESCVDSCPVVCRRALMSSTAAFHQALFTTTDCDTVLKLAWKNWDGSPFLGDNAPSCVLGTTNGINPIYSPATRTGYEFKGWKILNDSNESQED